jgi:4-carboxymuconolactone decarboxylase
MFPRQGEEFESAPPVNRVQAVARLPYVEQSQAPDEVRSALERAPELNIFRMMANAETAFVPWLRWGMALLTDTAVSPALRELAILRVARLTPGAEYEWVQHEAIARAVGVRDEQIDAVDRGETTAACFDQTERLLLAFTTEVVEDACADEQTLEQMKMVFSAREIVELLMTIGQYMMVARVMTTTDLELDEPAGASALGA